MQKDFFAHKYCTTCGMRISAFATKCPYCHEDPDLWVRKGNGKWFEFWDSPKGIVTGVVLVIVMMALAVWLIHYLDSRLLTDSVHQSLH